MFSRLRSYLFTSDSDSDSDNVNADQNTDDINTDQISFDHNCDDFNTDLSIDDPKSMGEDEETEKNFSYSTDQFSCAQNSDVFDVDLGSYRKDLIFFFRVYGPVDRRVYLSDWTLQRRCFC
mmetsp:Transcript_5997/g.8013  ORF Transcript_5997/g.8013 Transcript_5997/m.8013 type:complete len:121 (+) Transcript_5997:328-690(+)